MPQQHITVKGARVHNLKNIDITIPRDRFVVFTGLSGSGKSSLAFDTLYAEGHRRFVESLSSYARQFLGQLDKPDVDSIDGLSPSISIDQKTTSRNPRSTVGTVTEIYDYLRLLYARVGIPHCPVCGKKIQQQSIDQIIAQIMALPLRTRFMVLAPVIRGKKGMHEKIFEDAKKSGYVRVRADGSLYDLSEKIELDKNKKHNIEIVVDRLVMKPDIRNRLGDSVETALSLAEGNVIIQLLEENGDGEALNFSQNYACDEHSISIGELIPRMFSFNNPLGACPDCTGLGERNLVSPEKAINFKLSLRAGAVHVNGFKSIDDETWLGPLFEAIGVKYGFTLDTPICDMSKEAQKVIQYGAGREKFPVMRHRGNPDAPRSMQGFDGVLNIIQNRYNQTHDTYYEEFMQPVICPTCAGTRLKPEVLAVTVGELNIAQFCEQPVNAALNFISSLVFGESETQISREIIKEIKSRLVFMSSVGLEYLTLSRRAGSLSGGEAQRIRLATQIGSSLMGVLYILDEPSIGLHQRDNHKLIETLKRLRDVGNSLIVVEHDEETMEEADYIVDIGPGAGIHGGLIVAQGTPDEIKANTGSITGDYLSGRRCIPVPAVRRAGNGEFLRIYGARENNLKGIDVSIPLGVFVCVTGVSGSGKSSLINSIVYNILARDLNGAYTFPGKYDRIEGIENLDKVIAIDQSPIGRTPRSNPATYTGLFTDIRSLFASTPDAKMRGFKSNRFSFNLKGGRCETCEGDGVKRIEMHFLPDVYVICDVCRGRRYNNDTLDVKYKGKNIYEVLEMTVEEGLTFFSAIPRLNNRLQTLYDVGLGYIKIGQSSTTLSGGEAQRVKLAAELSRRSTGKTFYILDEPTTGLHSADVEKLIDVLQRLVDGGNTVVVIEHNLDIIKTADHIIDLGPEGGDAGGEIVALGTPEEIADNPKSYTGYYLKNILNPK
ncbi:MAG: excinuclease ABC subunit UvrA [Eubacteriales bacterium]|nr:excinuclease ABC subunit UvrA [Eubacteriales bacterium]